LGKKTRKTVLLTWQSPYEWEDLPEIDILQLPLTETKSLDCPQLETNYLQKYAEKEVYLLFFSKAGVKGFAHNFSAKSLPPLWKMACIGEQTAAELKSIGFEADYVGHSTGLNMVKDLHKQGFAGLFLMVAGTISSGQAEEYCLNHDLNQANCLVYENKEPEGAQEALDDVLERVALICLASPSAARRLLEGREKAIIPALLSIGPLTSTTIREMGFEVFWEAKSPGYESFREGIKNSLTK
jgi:uroporphyrinogen-III synthase